MGKGRSKKINKQKRFLIWLFIILFIGILFSLPATRDGLQWVYYKIYDKMLRQGPLSNKKVKDVGVPIPEYYSIHGIDISRYQNKIDWNRVKGFSSGPFKVSFVFIKATEGTSLVDPFLTTNWAGAAEVKIPRGAYHFFIPNKDPIKQASHFVNHVSIGIGDLPPVLDIENTGGLDRGALISNALVWLRLIEAHYGMKPIVYTGANFYNSYFKGSEIEKYPIWIAHYYMDEPDFSGKWTFWQHTDRARIDGIEGLVDLNVFAGSQKQFLDLLKK